MYKYYVLAVSLILVLFTFTALPIKRKAHSATVGLLLLANFAVFVGLVLLTMATGTELRLPAAINFIAACACALSLHSSSGRWKKVGESPKIRPEAALESPKQRRAPDISKLN